MVDRTARRQYAELVRQFISGRMTNDEYETRFEGIECNSDDSAIFEAYHQVWSLYDDLSTHRMTDAHRLDREGRRAIARMVLFLHSDVEYGWPKDNLLWESRTLLLFADAVVAVLLLGLFPASFLLIISGAAFLVAAQVAYYTVRVSSERRLWDAHGDTSVWPFLRQADLDEAARHPRLLNGGRLNGQ